MSKEVKLIMNSTPEYRPHAWIQKTVYAEVAWPEIGQLDIEFENSFGFSFLNLGINEELLVKKLRNIKDKQKRDSCIDFLMETMHEKWTGFARTQCKQYSEQPAIIEGAVMKLRPWVRFYSDEDLPTYGNK